MRITSNTPDCITMQEVPSKTLISVEKMLRLRAVRNKKRICQHDDKLRAHKRKINKILKQLKNVTAALAESV